MISDGFWDLALSEAGQVVMSILEMGKTPGEMDWGRGGGWGR